MLTCWGLWFEGRELDSDGSASGNQKCQRSEILHLWPSRAFHVYFFLQSLASVQTTGGLSPSTHSRGSAQHWQLHKLWARRRKHTLASSFSAPVLTTVTEMNEQPVLSLSAPIQNTESFNHPGDWWILCPLAPPRVSRLPRGKRQREASDTKNTGYKFSCYHGDFLPATVN